MAPTALVIGADGLIGSELFRLAQRAGWQTVGTSRHRAADASWLHFDLADPPDQLLGAPAVRDLYAQHRLAAFLMAGITGYDRCTGDPAGTRHVNVTCTARLAASLLAAGAFVVFPSSTAVFGDAPRPTTESSPTSPTTEYGKQKADAEKALLRLTSHSALSTQHSALPQHSALSSPAVVRLTKVLAATGLVGQWLKTLRTGGTIDAATNLCLSPVSLAFAAHGLLEIARNRRGGVYHLAGEQNITYFELAQGLAGALGVSPNRVRPVEIAQSTGVGNNVSLSMAETSQRTTLAPQPLDQAVDDLISAAKREQEQLNR